MKKAVRNYIIENIVSLIDYGDIGFEKNVVGVASELRAIESLKNLGYEIHRHTNPDAGGHPDFVLKYGDAEWLVEHKRASKTSYADGSFRLEFQKTRTSKGDPSSRFYDSSWCHIVSIDVSEHTNISDDKRFVLTKNLKRHDKYPNKIKALNRESNLWHKTLQEAIEELMETPSRRSK